MSWIVLKFINNTVDAVPSTWYDYEIKKCWWPKNATIEQQRRHIRERSQPDKTWRLYAANILGTYDDLSLADRKAEKARTTDQLSSQDECLKIPKQMNKANLNDNISSEDSSSDFNYTLAGTKKNQPKSHFSNNTNIKESIKELE
ncbi:uncharacterized protein [Prorops nasuta]|uniref:uncharacterized protein n=1 Tax=Prorops nasuta TaxID=863751 RepID=UPI0034CE971F